MNAQDEVRVRHMLDAAREAVTFIEGYTRSDLDTNRVLTLAPVKEIEIIVRPRLGSVTTCRRLIRTFPGPIL